MKMPFGKFKGREIHTMPRGYLRWMLANCDLQGDLLAAVEWGIEKISHDPKPRDIEAEVDRAVFVWDCP